MEQTIDITVFKKNPELFFEQLPKEAENEFENLLQYIVFKYNLSLHRKEAKLFEESQTIIEHDTKEKVFAKIPDGILKPICIENFKHYSREELHER